MDCGSFAALPRLPEAAFWETKTEHAIAGSATATAHRYHTIWNRGGKNAVLPYHLQLRINNLDPSEPTRISP